MTDIYTKLQLNDEFQLKNGDHVVVVRKEEPNGWGVFLDSKRIGFFRQQVNDRATYFESEIASEPGVTNWVSDELDTVIGRMLTLRD